MDGCKACGTRAESLCAPFDLVSCQALQLAKRCHELNFHERIFW